MKGCIGEPISWLRLERFGLGELPASERAAIEHHLAGCELCRACFSAVETARELPPLPAPAKLRRPAGFSWPVWAGGFAAALAAALLLFWKPADDSGHAVPAAHMHVKGGELALELVRRDEQGRQLAADRFEPGDRWKILLTCPPALQPHVDAVVYQSGRAFFPLDPQRLPGCGNRIALPGAFRLDGGDPALICVAVAETEPVARDAIGRGPAALPKLRVCARVAPILAR